MKCKICRSAVARYCSAAVFTGKQHQLVCSAVDSGRQPEKRQAQCSHCFATRVVLKRNTAFAIFIPALYGLGSIPETHTPVNSHA
ncbi:hypothetical protein OH492_13985 [Vibrio chagasii]|nr:hypothetical protein [Vibrio chagasii]